MPTASKKVINGWAMYDWANSAYSLVITSTIFPIYYSSITGNEQTHDRVSFFGISFINSVLFNYAISFSFLVIAFLSPILSSMADYRGNKKRFMQFFCYLGGLSCCAMYFFKSNTLELGIIAFILAAVGFCGSIVFYNAYLPEIADKEDQDRVSAKGFALGYIGSVLLLILCLLLVLKPGSFGISDLSLPARISFVLVGLWWMGFAQMTFAVLPSPAYRAADRHNIFTHGFKELQKVWREVQKQPVLKRFLRSFFFYSMGVQTVMYAAAIFGEKELHLESSQLIITVLLIQLVAIGGAWIMARLSEKMGNLPVLMMSVLFWIGICAGAYFIHTAGQFYVIAVCVGFVMGGIQSLSRSTYSKLMPATDDTASYFSYYDVCEKLSIVIGTGMFGYIEALTGSMRNSIIFLIVFFISGFVLLVFTLKKQFAVARASAL